MKSNKYINTAIIISLIYGISLFFLENRIASLPEYPVSLAWCTVILSIINIIILIIHLFHREKISFIMMLLLLIQLTLFYRLHIHIYHLNESAYIYPAVSSLRLETASAPEWSDWIKFIGVHLLKAIDLPDIIDAYGIRFQIINTQRFSSAITLFSMYMLVSLFLLSFIFKRINISIQYIIRKKSKGGIIKRLRIGVLLAIFIIIALVALKNQWGAKNGLLWLIKNILYTLDVGDAIQILNRNLSLVPGSDAAEMSRGLATLAILFRLTIGSYIIFILSSLYLRIFGDDPAEKLIIIAESSEKPAKERTDAINILKEFGDSAQAVVPRLIKILTDNNSNIVHETAEALENIDPEWYNRKVTRNVIPHLIESLDDPDKSIRMTAVEVLGKLGPVAAEEDVIRPLIKILINDDMDVRYQVAESLGNIGEAAVPELLAILTENDKDAKRAAIQALEKIDPQWHESEAVRKEIDRITRLLTETIGSARKSAIETLGKLGILAKDAVPDLIDILTDKEVRGAAVESLGKIGHGAEKAVPELIRILDDQNVRVITVGTLGKFGSGAKDAIPALIQVLADNDRNISNAAVESLNNIDPDWSQSEDARNAAEIFTGKLAEYMESSYNEPAEALIKIGKLSIYPLVKSLTDKNKDIIKLASQTLKQIDPEWWKNKGAHQAVPHLSEALTDEEWYVRYSAAEVLGRIGGPAAIKAVPYLVRGLADKNKTVRKAIKNSLDRITLKASPEEAQIPEDTGYKVSENENINRLVKGLQDADTAVRIESLKSLRTIEDPLHEAIPYIVRLLADKEGDVRNETVQTLKKIDPEWQDNEAVQNIIPELVERLDGEIESELSEPGLALIEIGTGATEHLVKALAHRNKTIVNTAAQILERTDPKWHESGRSHKAVPYLAHSLTAEEWYVRYAAAQILKKIGPPAVKAIPQLVKALADKNKTVRSAVKEAMDTIALRKS